MQAHTLSIQYLLVFHSNNCLTKAPQRYVIRTLPDCKYYDSQLTMYSLGCRVNFSPAM